MGAVAICSSDCDLFGSTNSTRANTTGEGILGSLAFLFRWLRSPYERVLAAAYFAAVCVRAFGRTEISTLDGKRFER